MLPATLTLGATSVLSVVAAAHEASAPADVAQYATYFNQTMVILDAENLTSADGGWQVPPLAPAIELPGYFASTVANVFHNRRAYLHAPANASASATASATFHVPEAGTYALVARYEGLYRFETPFQVTLTQGGKAVVQQVYGQRASKKVWAFASGRDAGQFCGPGLQSECHWPWGATENMVWEGVDKTHSLAAGPATLTVTFTNGSAPAGAHFADRNVDTFLLTQNVSDINMRLKNENIFLALDGLLSQSNEVYARVTNKNSTYNLSLTLPYEYVHSPYYGMHLHHPQLNGKTGAVASGCGCTKLFLGPSKASEWIEVGDQMGSFKQGTWNFPAPKPLKKPCCSSETSWQIEIAAKLSSEPISALKTLYTATVGVGQGHQVILGDNIRATHQVQEQGTDWWALYDELKTQKVGKPPTETPVFAGSFKRDAPGGGGFPGPAVNDSKYAQAVLDFESMFNLWRTDVGAAEAKGTGRGYTDLRSQLANLTKLSLYLEQNFVSTGLAKDVAVVSLGDEIGVAGKGNSTQFADWAKAAGLTPKEAGCTSWASCVYNTSLGYAASNPRGFYYSTVFSHDLGIWKYSNVTKIISKLLPKAAVGANMSPLGYGVDLLGQQFCSAYTGTTHAWIRAFRQGAFTLPWAEDWIWQSPMGTQQMMTMIVDVMRSSMSAPGASYPRPSTPFHWDGPGPYSEPRDGRLVSEAAPKHHPMMMYVMSHFPGNTPTSWSRQFWGDLAHGINMINLFDFDTSISGYTCDYVDSDGGSYQNVRAQLSYLAAFEDIVQPYGAPAALLYTETSDIYQDLIHTVGSAKRALYIALRHQQIPVDIVIEDDCTSGALAHYDVLYIVDPHIHSAASAAIADWVKTGGKAFFFGTAGSLDEGNATNTALTTLLGVQDLSVDAGDGSPIDYIKQDLKFVQTLDTVTASGNSSAGPWPVLGEKTIFKLLQPTGATVSATFKDGSPASFTREAGKGKVYYSAFHPSLAYFEPAIPAVPACRGSVDEAWNHWAPTAFDTSASAFIASPLQEAGYVLPVNSSNFLVEAGMVSAAGKGSALILINWTGDAVKGLSVQVNTKVIFSKATTATGIPVQNQKLPGNKYVFTLDVAGPGEAIILRP